MDSLKKKAAYEALEHIIPHSILGIGTGSTVNFFIDALKTIKNKIDGVVVSSNATKEKFKGTGIEVIDLNIVDDIPIYVDGTDLINQHLQMIKGGGGALTREKIVAQVAKTFVCIADESKYQDYLNTDHIPLPLEVIPMARSYIAREIVKLGATPVYRQGFITDNGNVILDIYNLNLTNPIKVEQGLNNIPGVVSNGLFANRHADILLLANSTGVKTMRAS